MNAAADQIVPALEPETVREEPIDPAKIKPTVKRGKAMKRKRRSPRKRTEEEPRAQVVQPLSVLQPPPVVSEIDPEAFVMQEDHRALSRARGWPAWVRRYLAEISTHGQKMKAYAAAGCDHTQALRLRRNDPSFVTAEEAAMRASNTLLVSEAYRRASEGQVERRYDPKTGALVSEKVVYSDILLLRLLEWQETGSWQQRKQYEFGGPGAFKSLDDIRDKLASKRAERDALPAGEGGAAQSQQGCIKSDSGAESAGPAVSIDVSASESAEGPEA